MNIDLTKIWDVNGEWTLMSNKSELKFDLTYCMRIHCKHQKWWFHALGFRDQQQKLGSHLQKSIIDCQVPTIISKIVNHSLNFDNPCWWSGITGPRDLVDDEILNPNSSHQWHTLSYTSIHKAVWSAWCLLRDKKKKSLLTLASRLSLRNQLKKMRHLGSVSHSLDHSWKHREDVTNSSAKWARLPWIEELFTSKNYCDNWMVECSVSCIDTHWL